jgi:hypothetical protein
VEFANSSGGICGPAEKYGPDPERPPDRILIRSGCGKFAGFFAEYSSSRFIYDDHVPIRQLDARPDDLQLAGENFENSVVRMGQKARKQSDLEIATA